MKPNSSPHASHPSNGPVEPSSSRPPNPGVRTEKVLGRQPAVPIAPPPAGPWKWHQRALLGLQTQLSQGRHDHREAAREPLEPHSLSEADSATDELDHDLALAQLAHEDDALFEIDEALRRIAEGRYGICEISGQPIEAERLRVIPWTRYTCEVERQRESSGERPGRGLPQPGTVRGSEGPSFEVAGESEEATEAADETLGQPRTVPPGGTGPVSGAGQPPGTAT